MNLNELKPKEGSKKARTRVGRGIGSGKGKTSGVGQKGQKSRSGVAIKGFEGGQMPLYQRLPKVGFRNGQFATKLSELTLGKLQAAIDTKKIDPKKPIDEKTLVEARVIKNKRDGVKLLASGELKTKVELKLTKASKAAVEAVEKAGGKIEFLTIEEIRAANKKEKSSDKKDPKKVKKEKNAKK